VKEQCLVTEASHMVFIQFGT